MKYIQLFLILLLSATLYGQQDQSLIANIVPNPSFEEYSSSPIGWFYTGKHFTSVMKYWSSPTAASPDVFGPKVTVPVLWEDKGFGTVQARNGHSMAGITLVGCGDGKPHCREYLQTPLLDALVIGQQYQINFWVRRLPGGYVINELGLLFKDKRTYIEDDVRLDFQNVIIAIAEDNNPNGWIKMKATFTAQDESDYLIIGNFNNDLDSNASKAADQSLSFGYYYIDDVEVHKIAPIINAPVQRPTWEGKELKPPATFILKNIFFDTDESTLLPRSFSELEKLVDLMKLYPNMVIQINGHTDSDGGNEYNDELSISRAVAVDKYLKQREIEKSRLSVKGFGLHKPVANNDTAKGKQLNRRVEFTIIAM